jgi:manganese/zinc/iron transport system permease protein
MDFGQLLHDILFDYTLRTVVLGSAILGLASGALGCFAVLRRQSLLGDALAHAALPGICLAFILSGQLKAPLVLLLGAAAAAWLGALIITVIIRSTRIKEDTAMGIVLVVFFGTGYVLLSLLQNSAGAGQAGLDKYLFGRASTMLQSDVEAMAALALLALLTVGVLFKEFKLLSFDPDYLSSLGFPARRLDILLTTLIVIAIVIGLQTVGVVLMSAMLIAPGAAARQWTNRLGNMIGVSMLIGVVAGASGALVSASAAQTPTGPAIVIILTIITLFSLAFGRERGLVWSALRHQRNRANLRRQQALIPNPSLAASPLPMERGLRGEVE